MECGGGMRCESVLRERHGRVTVDPLPGRREIRSRVVMFEWESGSEKLKAP